ncbi:MAG TPA: potassium transporter Kup [Polyangiaceae bacterium]|nr:potassium transporter Kup [Polyangiaceae bacterium]
MTEKVMAIEPHAAGSRKQLMILSLTALGVVFGDIGTSPLYAMRECLHGMHSVAPERDNVLGVLSLIFWALMLVVTVKYLAYVLRADNRGEGGILALMALASAKTHEHRFRHRIVILLGLFGAALLYGDGIITPAISVMSAVEGLDVAAPGLSRYVIPITIVILVFLFGVQSRGTAIVGKVFAPITLAWFTALAVLGIANIVDHPDVLYAVSPSYAFRFFRDQGMHGFLVLGSVVLVVTGGEAMYADMGHFGAKPIRLAWFSLVLPALLLNYFGQGALLINSPAAAENPFYRMMPSWAVYPMIVLSTLAAIIASQALISGAFSLTRQAIMLGFSPRLRIEHTSAHQIGQIYVPALNWMMMLATIGLVLGFGSSARLAATYGIAVVITMVITTLLAYIVARKRWRWSALFASAVTIVFLVPDLALFGANINKIPGGAWFPLLMAAGVFTVFTTWKRGRLILSERFREQMVPLTDFFELIHVERPARVPGVAVFMTSNAQGTPPALMHNFMHNRVVHQHVVLLTVVTQEVARVSADERLTVEELPEGFVRVVARYGFMEDPNIPALLAHGNVPGYALEHTTFFLGRETLLASEKQGMAIWRERLFAFLARNAQPATLFFGIPTDRVLEIGTQIEL